MLPRVSLTLAVDQARSQHMGLFEHVIAAISEVRGSLMYTNKDFPSNSPTSWLNETEGYLVR